MNKNIIFGVAALLMVMSLSACGSTTSKEGSKAVESSAHAATTSIDPETAKSVEVTNITLSNQSNKAYITVTGKVKNYTSEEFKWAWGIREQGGDFVDGKEKPAEEDFKKANISNNNSFTVRYCLTDIQGLRSGVFYRIYGGTPESYDDIEFQSNNYGASDASRRYYLRNDQNNSLVFDSIQPISFTKASVVNVAQSDLPEGVINAGPYLKFGGANSKGLTMDTINAWNEAGLIAGNFQRVIGDGYNAHTHVAEERFWKIEGDEVYFYCYIGFIEVEEGWMVHFDLVEGNASSNLQMDATIWGEETYTAGEGTYKVYGDKNKSGEENYWGCLGVYRVS